MALISSLPGFAGRKNISRCKGGLSSNGTGSRDKKMKSFGDMFGNAVSLTLSPRDALQCPAVEAHSMAGGFGKEAAYEEEIISDCGNTTAYLRRC